MKLSVFTCIVWSLLSCSIQQKEITIIPLSILDYDTTAETNGRIYHVKGAHYLVRDYQDTPANDSLIKRFVEERRDSFYVPGPSSCAMVFYKESSETNLENVNRMKWRIIDRYSQDHDLIFDFELKQDGFIVQKLKNGELVNDNNKGTVEMRQISE